uniref:Myb-like DNA-binding domain containing protein, putative n=1 Tax=Theileria annulata TaxID=5874 RepID=A0A3B0MNK1_THEAN
MDSTSCANKDSFRETSRVSSRSFSYSNLNNASLQLLKADFVAYSFLAQGKYFKRISQQISNTTNRSKHESSTSRTDFNPNLNTQISHNLTSKSNHDSNSNFDLKFKLDTKSKLDPKYYKLSPGELKTEFKFSKSNWKRSNLGPRLTYLNRKCHFNGISSKKHTYLCFFTALDLPVKSDHFEELFSQFENYVIKLFSVHPTLGSEKRGGCIDEDGSMIGSMLNYIRSYECSLHLLSQKPRNYFYISLFLLIVLLRNMRRLLHHYRPNSTLLELILILVEGIYLCQNHLHSFFHRTNRNILKGDSFKFEQSEGKRNELVNKKLLKSFNESCNRCRNSIYSLCKAESARYYDDSKPELKGDKCEDNKQDTALRSGNSVSDQPDTGRRSEKSTSGEVDLSEFETAREDIPTFYDNISSLTTRCESVDSRLRYELVEISELSGLNLVLDEKVSEWISELCNLSSFYCKLGCEPILLSNPFLKLTLNSDTVLPKVCKFSFTNLSFDRILHLKLVDSLFYTQLCSKSPEISLRSSQATPLLKPRKSSYSRWSDDEVNLLIRSINRYGTGNWSFIARAYFLGKKSPMQLKDKWANLVRYGHVKQLEPPKTKTRNLKKWTLANA